MSLLSKRSRRTFIVFLGVLLLCCLIPMAVSAYSPTAGQSVEDPLFPWIEESSPELMGCASGIQYKGLGPNKQVREGSGKKYAAGVMKIQIGSTTKGGFCIDMAHTVSNNDCYQVGSAIANPKIVWILNHYPPSTSLSGLEAAARQTAVWWYSDGYSATWPVDVVARRDQIIAEAEVGSGNPPVPPKVTITVDTQVGCKYFMRATTTPAAGGQVLTLNTTNGTLNVSTVTTDSSGQATFELTLSMGQCATVSAKGSINVAAGITLDSVVGGKQRLILGQPATVPYGGEKSVCCSCDVEVTVNDDTVCEGSAGTLTASVTGTCPGVQYAWTGPSGPAGTTQTIYPTEAGSYQVTVTCSNGCDASDSGSLTVKTAPTCGVGGESMVCVGDIKTYTYTGNPGSGVNSYAWTVGGDGVVQSGGGTRDNWVTVKWNGAGSVDLTVSGDCGPASCGKTVTIKTPPTCGFDGELVVCAGAIETYTYSGDPGSGVNSYGWSVTGGGVVQSGGGASDVSVTVKWNSSGRVDLTVHGDCGSAPCGQAITVKTAPTCGISGKLAVCVGSIETYTYSGDSGSGVNSYAWTVGGGGVVQSGGGTSDNSVTVLWNSAGSVDLTVTGDCGSAICGESISIITPPTCGVSGPAAVCLGDNEKYTYTGVPGSGVDKFSWSISPAGSGTITAGGGTSDSFVEVTWASSGRVNLTVENACGKPSCGVDIDVEAPPTCDFSGPAEAEIGETTTYTYTGQRATAWSWTVTGGTIQGDPTASSIDVLWDTPGAARVDLLVSNRCGEADCGQDVTLLCSIGDYVWYDVGPLDGQQGSEPPVGGVWVELYDDGGSLLDSMQTDAAGLYGFGRLQPGKYYVRFYPPTGYALTVQNSGADVSDSDADRTTGITVVTELTPGEHDGTWDAGLYRLVGGGFGGYKFWDTNVSATWEQAVEPRIAGVKIIVKDASGAVVHTTYTKDAPGTVEHGSWMWPTVPGLLPGEYTVEEVKPTDWICTYPPANGHVYRVLTKADGTFELLSPRPAGFTGTLDFGNARPMGFKFQDENRNARRDSGEGLLGNWRITLQDMNYRVVYSTHTVAGGSSAYYGWWFLTESLPAGDYYVFEEQKDGWEQTYPEGYNGAYKIHLNADGSYQLLSGRNTWHDGLSFGNAPYAAAPECPLCPEWVVFQSDRVEGNENIFRMRFDGSEVTQLTDDLDQDIQPSWAFNGLNIAFASNRDGDWEIYRMSADGTGEMNVTQTPLATDGMMPSDDLAPSWSCEWIAFQSNRDGNWEIYKTDPDGITQIRLTEDDAADEAPVWSMDGQWIAFQSDRDGDVELYIMDGEGENLRQLTDNNAFDGNPTWSLEGDWIAFESDRDGQLEIYKINVATGEVIRLTDDAGVDAAPAWAPYCEWIFWQTNREENQEVYRMAYDGTLKMNLTEAFDWADQLDMVPEFNRAPKAVADEAETNQGVPVTIMVLDNDLDADGDALTVASMSAPANGWCKLNADGSIAYTPAVEFVGADTFTYTVSDVNGATETATVTVTVNAMAGMGRRLFLGIVVTAP